MRCLPAVVLCALPLFAQEKVDLSAVNRIRNEAFENSKVMDTLESLTDRYGPRLTGSPEFDEAAAWAVKRLESYGLQNVHTEKWGPFGRSWSLQQFSVEMVEPRYSLLAAWPLAWTRPTQGAVSGDVFLAPLGSGRRSFDLKKNEADLNAWMEKYKGKLKGKVVLLSPLARDITANETKPALVRYTDAELANLANAPEPAPKLPYDPANLVVPDDPQEQMKFITSLPEPVLMKMIDDYQALIGRRNDFLAAEGVIAVLASDRRAHDALTFSEQAGPHDEKHQLAPPIFVVTAEHYNRLARLAEKKEPVRIAVMLKVKTSNRVDAVNVLGEIPGTDRKDEVVMVGAHFDSWHSGTGATDNGAGSAVMMEVMRILKAADLKMDRTVRIGLWSGEEEGLLGSKAYVKEHFADPATMRTTTEHGNLSGYFNLDNGSGKIRGVYLQGNDAMRPLFEAWLRPFHDLGVTTISIRNTGGTDHLSFVAVGLPGFQFIQDPLDYMTVTHHSNMDTFDHAQAGDLMQAAAVIASCVYDAATRPEKLPRVTLPKPEGPGAKPPAAATSTK